MQVKSLYSFHSWAFSIAFHRHTNWHARSVALLLHFRYLRSTFSINLENSFQQEAFCFVNSKNIQINSDPLCHNFLAQIWKSTKIINGSQEQANCSISSVPAYAQTNNDTANDELEIVPSDLISKFSAYLCRVIQSSNFRALISTYQESGKLAASLSSPAESCCAELRQVILTAFLILWAPGSRLQAPQSPLELSIVAMENLYIRQSCIFANSRKSFG